MRRGTRTMLPTLVGLFVLGTLVPLGSPGPVGAVSSTLVINEIDYDQPSTDTAEFLELKNVSAGTLDLSEFTVELVNGSTNAVYLSFHLDGSLAAGDYYVICANAATTANCDLDVGPDSNLIQNGEPDAVGLRQNGTLVDAVSYEGNTTGYTEGSGVGLVDDAANANESISRCPDGTDTDQNNTDFALRPATPGTVNHCSGDDTAPAVDSTTPANGASNVALGADIEITFSEQVAVSGEWFTIVCSDSGAQSATASGGPTSWELDPDSDLPEAESCTVTVVAAQVTDQDTEDPPDNMAADHAFSFTTVGFVPPEVIINEIDSDTPGTDTLEFVELYDGGEGNTALDGLVVVFFNGSNDASYSAFDLDGHSTDASGYFLMGNPAVNPTPALTFSGNGLQNGADAVALYSANRSDFPNGTPVTTASLVDAIVYGTSDADDAGLLVLLNDGEPQVDENSRGAGTSHSNQRCPDGSGGARNTSTYEQFTPTPGAANSCVDDDPPSVEATSPPSGLSGVATDANIEITFSEPVDVSGAWFTISCSVSGAHTATSTGGPTTFVLDPDADFAVTEICTVTVVAAQVTDQDSNDPPDSMSANHVISFATAGAHCDEPFVPIYDIQGDGASAAITGNVTTQGVVVGDFETGEELSGFYLQDPTGDGNPATSDGIFVSNGTAVAVDEGDLVRVSGTAGESFGETQISAAVVVDCDATASVDPADVEMPFAEPVDGLPYLERFEGMLVRFPQSLVISEYFNYDRFGEIVLGLPLPGEERHFTPTLVEEPGAAAQARFQEYLLRRITLDDGLSVQNPQFTRHPNGDPFSLTNRFRGGDTVANAVGVLGFSFSLYRIQPTGPADYTPVNERPAEPEDVGGRLKVAAFNMLNFFITPDFSGGPLDNACGPQQNVECRGHDADQPDEFERQRDKLLAALEAIDADIVGLNEIENTTGVDPLGDPQNGIVAGLNERLGAGTYDHIDTGVIGPDTIRVGFLYKPAAVVPVGDFEILDSSVDPRFDEDFSRPALAQTFEEVATGERFTVVVNHLKSKGSACPGDPDTGDGQGNCNLTRLAAAQALVDWLATDPTGSDDPDFLITGDLNAYAKEDPIDAVKAGPDDIAGTVDDYTNLVEEYVGPFAYSFVFDGQAGYLDHALANPSLTLQVTGATEWHINADEPDILDYDTSFKSDTQDELYEPDAYRSSDHDPLIVGLELAGPGRVTGGGTFADGSFELSAQRVPDRTLAGGTTFEVDGVGTFESTAYDWLVVEGLRATYAGSGELDGAGDYEFLVSAIDGGTPGRRGDLIRLMLWDPSGELVYDSQPGDHFLAAPTSAVTGGNVTVQSRR